MTEPLTYADLNLVPDRRHTVGTLSYTTPDLSVLFAWLILNSLCLVLLAQAFSAYEMSYRVSLMDRKISPQDTPLINNIARFLGFLIGPLISTWSDRQRTRFGRRRPILMGAMLLSALTLCVLPCIPDLYRYFLEDASLTPLLELLPGNGEVWFVNAANSIHLLIYSTTVSLSYYYCWDVVPANFQGRFQALSGFLPGLFLWGWIYCNYRFELWMNYPTALVVGASLICPALYLLSLWQVKEGKYPAPEPYQGKVFNPIGRYFKECFGQRYYLWIFLGTLLYQTSSIFNEYIYNYNKNDLHLATSDFVIAWWAAPSLIISVGFFFGLMLDRLHTVRVLPYLLLGRAAIQTLAFCLVRDKLNMVLFNGLDRIIEFCLGVALGAVVVELFPREKMGQFYSAQCLFHQFFLIFIPLPITWFFEWIKFNRLAYLFSAIFSALAGLVVFKVYFHWKQRQTTPPLYVAAAGS